MVSPVPVAEPFPNLHPFSSPDNTIQPQYLANTTAPTIQPLVEDEAAARIEVQSERDGDEADGGESEGEGGASAEKVEELARVIYQLVRQRLSLERERFGGSSSGRLPW